MKMLKTALVKNAGYREGKRSAFHCQFHSKSADWFTCYLFRTWQKADLGNRSRIARGFPDECEAFEDWANCPNGEREFFKEYM
jgi:hypothetical protein